MYRRRESLLECRLVLVLVLVLVRGVVLSTFWIDDLQKTCPVGGVLPLFWSVGFIYGVNWLDGVDKAVSTLGKLLTVSTLELRVNHS